MKKLERDAHMNMSLRECMQIDLIHASGTSHFYSNRKLVRWNVFWLVDSEKITLTTNVGTCVINK